MYDQIAYYYDLTHADLTEDVAWVLELAAEANGRILELGCGSGRLLLPLAQAGFSVTGVDNSSAMLARAAERLAAAGEAVQKRVSLVEQDATTLTLPGETHFALALIPYNTAMHFDTRQLVAVLRRVRGMVTENGRLAIDVINPAYIIQTPDEPTLALDRVIEDTGRGETVLQLSSNWLDSDKQTLHITWVYDASPIGGGAVRRTVAQSSYHYRFPHQWELLLQDGGWQLEAVAGGYSSEPFTEESERLLLFARPGK
ncbi:MAG: class I SAM-dependent methyltransferase [Candidatus Promineifilaceae bacterium]